MTGLTSPSTSSRSLEMSLESERSFNDLKRIRLLQVREQERQISAMRNEMYRNKLQQCKLRKENIKKENKHTIITEQLEDLTTEWQRALVSNGESHVSAIIQSKETKQNDKIVQIKMRNASLKAETRSNNALIKIHQVADELELENKKKLDLQTYKQEFKTIDRENARAAAESRYALLQQMAIPPPPVPPIITSQERTMQAAVAVHMRGPKTVHARITRHGPSEVDNTVVKSDAKVELENTHRRLWTRLMSELKQSKQVKIREEAAKKKVSQASGSDLLLQGLQYLRGEDRAVERLAIPRNVKSVEPYREPAHLAEDFAHLFAPPPTLPEHGVLESHRVSTGPSQVEPRARPVPQPPVKAGVTQVNHHVDIVLET